MKTIIIDDEPQIRKGIKILIQKSPYPLEIVDEAGSVKEGIKSIQKHHPDIVFFDIQLEDGSSFEILNQLEHIDFQLIFITAFDQYAIKAFKYSAIDYLLKPVIPSELNSAIARAVELHDKKNIPQDYQLELLNEKTPNKIVLRTAKKIYLIEIKDIIRCNADQSYTSFHIQGTETIVVSKPLKEYEEILPTDNFLRIHKSHLINIKKVVSYDKEGFLEMCNGDKIPVSSRKKEEVISILFDK